MTDRDIYKSILKLKNLRPSKATNKLFSMLVSFAMNSQNKKTLNEEELDCLRQVCSKAESEMEHFWANKIIMSSHPEETLKSFWYYQNYENLSMLEWESLKACVSCGHRHEKAIFIGSGPLPLTAIFLAQKFHVNFLLVDIDAEALDLSKRLISRLCLSEYFEFSSDNFDRVDLKRFDMVFLAALVGQDNKEVITENVIKKMSKGAHLLCRSVYDNRDLLYKPLDIYKMKIKPIREIRTYDEIINSIIIFKK